MDDEADKYFKGFQDSQFTISIELEEQKQAIFRDIQNLLSKDFITKQDYEMLKLKWGIRDENSMYQRS